ETSNEIQLLYSPEVKKLLKEFNDTFSTTLPNGLSPERRLDHAIDLIPVQLSDLLKKGFIQPSVSPF
ncbi:28204_t:CDS:2, partial [Dentiscutata erythropus]